MVIPSEIRETIRRFYEYRCGYCGVHEDDCGSELEIDHFRPRAAGGDDAPDNLVYCCAACNRIKGDFWPSDETKTKPSHLLHPGRDNLSEHLHEGDNGQLIALSAVGRFHISRLRLNRLQLCSLRRNQRTGKEIQQELREVSREREQLQKQIASLSKELEEALALLDRLQRE
jgi:hypothetical protein